MLELKQSQIVTLCMSRAGEYFTYSHVGFTKSAGQNTSILINFIIKRALIIFEHKKIVIYLFTIYLLVHIDLYRS